MSGWTEEGKDPGNGCRALILEAREAPDGARVELKNLLNDYGNLQK